MSKHMKRLAAPRVLQIHRKEKKWVMKPSPGAHPLTQSIALGLVLREYLKLTDTYKETKRVIAIGDILVDGVPRKNHKYPCGLMDVISIPKLKRDYRVLFNRKGRLVLVPIEPLDASWKLCLVRNKTIIRGKQTQLNLHDGRNIIVEKDEYKTGDVLKFSLKEKKILEVIKFEKGAVSLIVGGSHVGQVANIKDIQVIQSSKPNLAYMSGNEEFYTISEYVFPIGSTKPVITLPEVSM